MTVKAQDFGKVAVLMGGWSNERAVSLVSGAAVLRGLRARGVDAHGIDMGRDIAEVLQRGAYDRVFNIVHGRGGEDGQLQGLLDVLGLPYTGSGVLGSAIGMDKYRTKLIWRALGIATPEFRLIKDPQDLSNAAAELGFPLVLKAALEGSSIGVVPVMRPERLQAAWDEVSGCDSHVIAEQWVQGTEYTAAIIAEQTLPLIRLQPAAEFYDYQAKYHSDQTQYHLPCGLSAEQESQLQALSLKAFAAVGASGWGRVDLILDAAHQPWLIEVNTVPGMTDHSLVPMAAAAVGIDFEQLVWQILQQTLLQGAGYAG